MQSVTNISTLTFSSYLHNFLIFFFLHSEGLLLSLPHSLVTQQVEMWINRISPWLKAPWEGTSQAHKALGAWLVTSQTLNKVGIWHYLDCYGKNIGLSFKHTDINYNSGQIPHSSYNTNTGSNENKIKVINKIKEIKMRSLETWCDIFITTELFEAFFFSLWLFYSISLYHSSSCVSGRFIFY